VFLAGGCLLFALSVSAASGYEGDSAANARELWQQQAPDYGVSAPTVIQAVKHDTSKPLRQITPIVSTATTQAPENPIPRSAPGLPDSFDPTLQTAKPKGPMQPPNASFDGVPYAGSSCGCAPPDTNGDVGPTQYVQTVNVAFAVYSKTGTTLYGPAAINTLFSGFGGPCETTNDGDPIVQYDQLADRWVITQFSVTGPYYQCVAISKTSDATGAYYRYAFQISTTEFNDYPKVGVWRDGYYVSFNDFTGGVSFSGATVVAFDRDKMLLGQAAIGVKFKLDTGFASLLPGDLDGTTRPPTGAPDAFVQIDDNAPVDQLEVWKFHVDFGTPANSTFTADGNLGTSSFTQLSSNIPQAGTSNKLDTLGDRLMYRLAYRNFGDHEALVVNHSVNVGSNRAGVRWYELRNTGGAWSLFQQGTYAPSDGLNRWMGSVAMDKFGNMAGGWSTSSSTAFPSINYGGRLATDAAGQITAESVMKAGGGSQTSPNRWGDYSSISVDPTDDCTFWYTTEYYSTTSSWNWKTRIASFRFPACGPGGGGGTPTITSISPTSGPVGTSVTVNGTNFTGATSVKFNVTSASYTVDTPTKITATVPAGATSGHVSVTTPGGTAKSTTNFIVTTGGGSPTVTSFTPTGGSVNTIVTIKGTGFTGATGVKFNGTSATEWVYDSPTQVRAKVPAGATTGPISVTTTGGTGTSASSFTVTGGGSGTPTITTISPTSGPVGTTVTINGTNFTGATAVTFNFVGAAYTVVNASKITATVPAGATSGHIRVTTPGGTATSPNFLVT
jgi:hypothetical protein